MKTLILFYQLWFAYVNALPGFENTRLPKPKFMPAAQRERFYRKFERKR